MNDARISDETLRALEGPYRVVASSLDFSALSKFERWLRLSDRVAAAPGAIDQHDFAVLEALDMALKSQLLDWLESRRDILAGDLQQRRDTIGARSLTNDRLI
jgi:hypothetical protein